MPYKARQKVRIKMTHNENITAILECYFTGFKKEIIDSACNRILEQDPKTDVLYKIREEIDSHCSDNRDRNDGLYIAMKIIDKYIAEGSKK